MSDILSTIGKAIRIFLCMALLFLFLFPAGIDATPMFFGGGSGSGDVTKVGDCASGDCYDGSSDGGTYFRLYDGTGNYLQGAVSGALGSDKTINLDAIDISDFTNLAVDSNELTLTGDSLGLADHDSARSALGLAIGSDVQGFHAYLTDIAGITANQGDIIYFDGSDWVDLAPGDSGKYLKTQGAGANPMWDTPAGGGTMSSFFAEDGDGTEVEISDAKEWKFVEGASIDIDWTDTSDGTDADPYDLTVSVVVADDESTNDAHEVVFTTDNATLESDGDLNYNPSTGTLAVTLLDVGRYAEFTYANDTENVAPFIELSRAKVGPADVVDNNHLGDIRFYGYGSGSYQMGAKIVAAVDGTPGADATDMPSELQFLTSADDSATPTLRGVVGSDGAWKFGDGAWTNYVQISSAGVTTFAGTGDIDLPDNSVDNADLTDDCVTMAELDEDGNFTDWTGNWTFSTGTFTLAAGATISDGQSLTFDESAADPNDCDVVLSATDGVFTIAGANGANNEDLTFDVDATADTVAIGSSTGVATLDFGSMALTSTGTITGGSFDAGASATPGVTGYDSDQSDDDIWKIYGNANDADDSYLYFQVEQGDALVLYATLNGVTETIDLVKPLKLTTTGVQLTGSNGALTILGLGDGQDEDVKIDLNSTANTIEITSPSSSADTVDFNTLAVRSTGIITGKVDIEESSDATLDVTAEQHYGGVAANGDADAIEIDLDAAVVGMSILIIDNAGGAITLDPNGTDTIVYDGTAAAAGEAIISSGAKGDFAALICLTANQWIVLGHDSNGWTEASP